MCGTRTRRAVVQDPGGGEGHPAWECGLATCSMSGGVVPRSRRGAARSPPPASAPNMEPRSPDLDQAVGERADQVTRLQDDPDVVEIHGWHQAHRRAQLADGLDRTGVTHHQGWMVCPRTDDPAGPRARRRDGGRAPPERRRAAVGDDGQQLPVAAGDPGAACGACLVRGHKPTVRQATRAPPTPESVGSVWVWSTSMMTRLGGGSELPRNPRLGHADTLGVGSQIQPDLVGRVGVGPSTEGTTGSATFWKCGLRRRPWLRTGYVGVDAVGRVRGHAPHVEGHDRVSGTGVDRAHAGPSPLPAQPRCCSGPARLGADPCTRTRPDGSVRGWVAGRVAASQRLEL